MQQPSLTKYAMYIKEKAGWQMVEREYSWATYHLTGETVVIHDFWVHPDHRNSGEGSELLKNLEFDGCKEMLSTVMTNSEGKEQALTAQFKRGFKIVATDSEKIYLERTIWDQ